MNQFLYNYVFCGITNREVDTWSENLWCINLNEYDYWGSNQGFSPGHTWSMDTVEKSIHKVDILRLK